MILCMQLLHWGERDTVRMYVCICMYKMYIYIYVYIMRTQPCMYNIHLYAYMYTHAQKFFLGTEDTQGSDGPLRQKRTYNVHLYAYMYGIYTHISTILGSQDAQGSDGPLRQQRKKGGSRSRVHHVGAKTGSRQELFRMDRA